MTEPDSPSSALTQDKPTADGQPDDAALLARSAAGDRAAFDLLASRHLGRLYRIALQLTGGAAEAEDVAQEAMLRAWRGAGRFDPAKGRVAPWLNRIVLNLVIDRQRGARPALDPLAEDLADTTPDAVSALQYRQRQTALAAGLAALPERQRAAIFLTYFEEAAGIDAARTLGVSIRALEGLLRRGRLFLRDWLRAGEA